MSQFESLKSSLAECFKGVNRYNPGHIPELQQCITAMLLEGQYDKDVLLTTLKLYQLNPKEYNEEFTRDILLKTMMVFPRNDYALAKYLIDTNRANSNELRRVADLGALLEACNFSVFWRLFHGDYVPSDSPDEKFRNPEDVQRLLKPMVGFADAVRHYACRVITTTFQTIDGDQLMHLLGDISEGECLGYARLYKWEKRADGTFWIRNHEASVKSRNVEERIKFDQCADVLKAYSGN